MRKWVQVQMCKVNQWNADEGKIIWVQRPGYRHYGVNMGDGTVIHFAGEKCAIDKDPIIRLSTMQEFLSGGKLEEDTMITYSFALSEVAKRAESQLGTNFSVYEFLTNNCEHFATWCATGKRTSRQVGFLNDDSDVVEKLIYNVFEVPVRFFNNLANLF